MLALWVLSKPKKGRGTELLHVIPFDPKVDTGTDAEKKFVDAMRDFVTINQRLLAFEQALEAHGAAANDALRKKAVVDLAALLDEKIELLRPELDGLLRQKVGPWEKRAQDRTGRL